MRIPLTGKARDLEEFGLQLQALFKLQNLLVN